MKDYLIKYFRSKPISERVSFLLRMFLPICAGGIVLVSFISLYFGSMNFFLDLFSHFQLLYVEVLVLLGLVMIVLKLWKEVALVVLYITYLLSAYILPINYQSASPRNQDIFFINMYIFNEASDDIFNEILTTQPETVVVVEASEQMINSLKDIYGEPKSQSEISGPLACVIYSSRDIVAAGVDNESEYPICWVEFNDYTLYSIHPVPPLTNTLFQRQKRYFEYAGGLIEEESENGRDFILVGDFNSTYYSRIFRENFSQYFHENNYTWNTRTPLTLPIDHALSNREIEVTVSRALSSDHKGLFVNLVE